MTSSNSNTNGIFRPGRDEAAYITVTDSPERLSPLEQMTWDRYPHQGFNRQMRTSSSNLSPNMDFFDTFDEPMIPEMAWGASLEPSSPVADPAPIARGPVVGRFLSPPRRMLNINQFIAHGLSPPRRVRSSNSGTQSQGTSSLSDASTISMQWEPRQGGTLTPWATNPTTSTNVPRGPAQLPPAIQEEEEALELDERDRERLWSRDAALRYRGTPAEFEAEQRRNIHERMLRRRLEGARDNERVRTYIEARFHPAAVAQDPVQAHAQAYLAVHNLQQREQQEEEEQGRQQPARPVHQTQGHARTPVVDLDALSLSFVRAHAQGGSA